MFLVTKKKSSPIQSVHQCFQLIYFILYYTGCLGCKIRNDKEEICYDKYYNIYRNIYRFIYLSGLIGGILYKLLDEELKDAIVGRLPPVVKVTLLFECIVCTANYLVVTIFLDWQHNKYINLANTLQTLDKQLQKQFKNIEWNYEKSKRKYNTVTVILYGFYVIVSSTFIFNIANCASGWISSIMLSVSYTCVTGTPAFAEYLFVSKLDMLRLRFRLIKKLLRQRATPTCEKSRQILFENVSKIKLLENYFMKYSTLIASINQLFWLIGGSGLFHDFAIITSLGYLLCSKAFDSEVKVHEYAFLSLFMAPRIYKVISSAIYGHATQNEREKCFREFIKIGYYFKKSYLIELDGESLLHWRMHNNYSVTVGKFLNYNLSLIVVILNSVTNYILILIQLQFQQSNIADQVVSYQSYHE